MKNINETLCRVIGTESIDDKFGEPFIEAYAQLHGKRDGTVIAAAYTCSIFLSCILNGYPTDKLRIFVNYTKEEYKRITFNCNMYEKIYEYMNSCVSPNIILLTKDGYTETHPCSKQDIFEAFDFYTNQ